MFLAIVLTIWAAMHLYVFWRAASVPWVADHVSRRTLALIGLALWSSYVLARLLNSWGVEAVGVPLEFFGAGWIGVLFLLFSTLLVTDVVTVGGMLLPRFAPTLRGWAVIAAGVLSVVALAQGLRRPIVRDYEVPLAGLPPERDGLVLVAISDVHLGKLIGQRWMARLVDQVNAVRPDLVAVIGDLVDGNVDHVETLVPVLKNLRAPLGVWAVTGNHEYYAGITRSVQLFTNAGFFVLRDRSAEVVPGLVLAGVDDLTAREQFGQEDRAVEKTLSPRPPGALLLLSHTPWQADVAAAGGAGLMLSGHTHNGQIWPFTYLVQLRYPFMAGRYQVNGMPLIVCRGTGTWGPRMRLWRPAELLRIRLRAVEASR